MDKIVVYGCGGHAMSIIDTIKENGEYQIIGFVDKTKSDYVYEGISIIATDDDVEYLKNQGITYGAIGIGSVYGNSNVRKNVFEKAKQSGVIFPIIKDNSAIVSDSAVIKEGTFIGKGAIINCGADIGKCCIINTGSIIEHCVKIGDYSHVAVGSVICGDVHIGKNCLIGANATIKQGIKIGNNVTVGAGAVVIDDIEDGVTVVGSPARVIG